jgi:hypothetical protein
MAFSLNRIGLNILMKYKLFAKNKIFPTDKWILICLCEIGMSSLLRYEGYSLFSLMTHQGEIVPTRIDNTDDYWWTHRNSIFPLYEFIFVKYAPYISYHEKNRYDRK